MTSILFSRKQLLFITILTGLLLTFVSFFFAIDTLHLSTRVDLSDPSIPLDKYQLPAIWSDISSFNDIALNPLQLSSYNFTSYFASHSLNRSDFFFTSHYWNGSAIRIHAIIYLPSNTSIITFPAPAVVCVHGWGGSGTGLDPWAHRLAAEGYVAMVIDLPGQGGRSNGPSGITDNWFNVTTDVKGSYFYHAARSVYRSLTFIRSFTGLVDPDKVMILGYSFGGLMTYIISALDDQLVGGFPIVATGHFEKNYVYGGYMAGIFAGTTIKQRELFVQNFDPLIYASLNTRVPILPLIGTNDEFFELTALNDTLNVITAPHAHLLLPNVHHSDWYEFVSPVIYWARYLLKDDYTCRPANITTNTGLFLDLWGSHAQIALSVDNSNLISSVTISYYTEFFGTTWKTVELPLDLSGGYKITLDGSYTHSLLFFATVHYSNGVSYSTAVFEAPLVGHVFAFPFWAFFSVLLIFPSLTIVLWLNSEIEIDFSWEKIMQKPVFVAITSQGLALIYYTLVWHSKWFSVPMNRFIAIAQQNNIVYWNVVQVVVFLVPVEIVAIGILWTTTMAVGLGWRLPRVSALLELGFTGSIGLLVFALGFSDFLSLFFYLAGILAVIQLFLPELKKNPPKLQKKMQVEKFN
ncbi:MAG: alpha/beta hydrolase [Candidatus Hodarchaeota archaeon]